MSKGEIRPLKNRFLVRRLALFLRFTVDSSLDTADKNGRSSARLPAGAVRRPALGGEKCNRGACHDGNGSVQDRKRSVR